MDVIYTLDTYKVPVYVVIKLLYRGKTFNGADFHLIHTGCKKTKINPQRTYIILMDISLSKLSASIKKVR